MAASSAQWARIEELLPKALELPPERRSEFLRRHCGSEPELLAELEALVHAAEAPGDFLDSVRLNAPGAPAEEALPPGTQLGAWQLGSPIGHGGMGQVYAAERCDGQFEMSAALKVLKRGLDTDALLKRFRQERRILARLSHPGIARLLDAGATPDGRPYFVMERVDGEPVTEYCRRTGAGVAAILRLVGQACQAVTAAHRERIVHRDLKPSNLVVTAAGEIKLLDFGIAKALSEKDDATQTQADTRLLSPSYAAPEQILGEPVSAATDVYALGVVLYELLTGRLPHRREGVPLMVLTAELRHETTQKPSRALERAAAGLAPEVQRRARELAGDLDHIVLKAMHADPQRRYPSAFELAEDLARYLEHRPVLARPDSAAYRIGRFVRRYPVQVAAAAIAVLALVAGLAVATWQARVARMEARRAEDHLATAQAVSAFVTQDLLASIDPDKRSTANITLKEMLDTASGQLDKRFADRPQVAAELHHALGQSYGGLGLHEEKRAHAARAVALFERLYGPDAEPTLKARDELGVATRRIGDLRAALAIQQEVLRGWRARLPEQHPEVLLARLQVASLKEALGGNLAESIAEIRTVVQALERSEASIDDVRLAQLTLADLLKSAAEYAEAEVLYRKLVESLAQRPAARYLMRPRMESSLADVLTARGSYDEADRTLAQLEAELVKLLPPTHDQFLNLHLRYARLRTEQGRLADAEAHARPLLESKGVLWPLVARVILSETQMRAGRPAQAAATASRLMSELKELMPPEDSSFVEVSALLGEALTLAGRKQEAAAALELGRAGLPQLPHHHPMLAQYRRAQGLLWLAGGNAEEGRAALADALAIYEERLGRDHWRSRRVRDELAGTTHRIAGQ